MLGNQGGIGCLLIGDTVGTRGCLRALHEGMRAGGIRTQVVSGAEGNLLSAAQEKLFMLRERDGMVAIVAEGELWPIAIALAEQVQVDKIVLVYPVDIAGGKTGAFKRIANYARHYLSFCVSEIMVLEAAQGNPRAARRMDALWRGLCNAQMNFLNMEDKTWTNCEQSFIEAIIRFLAGGEFSKSLAK